MQINLGDGACLWEHIPVLKSLGIGFLGYKRQGVTSQLVLETVISGAHVIGKRDNYSSSKPKAQPTQDPIGRLLWDLFVYSSSQTCFLPVFLRPKYGNHEELLIPGLDGVKLIPCETFSLKPLVHSQWRTTVQLKS